MERIVLIGVDDSKHSEAAFDYYVQHLHRPRNRVTLIYVVKPFIADTNEMIFPRHTTKEDAKAEEKRIIKYIESVYREKMKKHSIPGRLSVVCYCKKPGKVICETAHDARCCYVVLGGGETEENLVVPQTSGEPNEPSSVCDYVLKRCKCPVIIARSRTKLNAPPPKPTAVVSRAKTPLAAQAAAKKAAAKTLSDTSPLQRSASCPPPRSTVGARLPASHASNASLKDTTTSSKAEIETVADATPLTSLPTLPAEVQPLPEGQQQHAYQLGAQRYGGSLGSAAGRLRLAAFNAGRRLSIKVEEDETSHISNEDKPDGVSSSATSPGSVTQRARDADIAEEEDGDDDDKDGNAAGSSPDTNATAHVTNEATPLTAAAEVEAAQPITACDDGTVSGDDAAAAADVATVAAIDKECVEVLPEVSLLTVTASHAAASVVVSADETQDDDDDDGDYDDDNNYFDDDGEV